jgi:hypothetical protein
VELMMNRIFNVSVFATTNQRLRGWALVATKILLKILTNLLAAKQPHGLQNEFEIEEKLLDC